MTMMRAEIQIEEIAVLRALGFSRGQIARVLAAGVSSEQLRGMLQLRRCEGAPAAISADIAARIDRIAQLEKSAIDSLTT
jgi:hypothetical protein